MDEDRYPDLALFLQCSPPPAASIVFDEIGAELGEGTKALYVYGLGRLSSKVQQWLFADPSRHLIFLEDNLSALALFKDAILSHPQIHLKWTLASWDLILESAAAEFPFDTIAVTSTPAYAKRSSFRKIQESLLRKTLLWHSVTSEEISGHLLQPNIIANLHRLPHCFYVNQWQGAWQGTPAIICGAGPSLESVAQDVKNVQDRALIIAGGSALSALSHLNIRPHLGIAADPNPREFDCLKGCRYKDLPLLFASRLHPKVFELFQGPYGYIRCGSGGRLESYIEEKLGLIDPYLGQDMGREALSVTTLAISLAHYFGCNPIILAGVDLSVAKNYYASGVPAEATPLPDAKRRLSSSGDFVKTTLKWIMERDVLDGYAKDHPETLFFNTSTRGLKFSHIPQAKILDALADFSSADIPTRLQTLINKTEVKVSHEQITALFAPLHNSMKTSAQLIQLLGREEAGSGKAILYESDLEQEIAYQLLLANPRFAFERLGKTDVWQFLGEVAHAYVTQKEPL
jgi:hypothetical protein